MIQIIASVFIAVAATEAGQKKVSAEEKRRFFKLVSTLTFEREFFTPKAVQEAAPHTRVLLSLTSEDLRGRDLYPFLALSRQLLDLKDQRVFGVEHFNEIAHEEIKMSWGAVLFEKRSASPDILKYLRTTIASEEGKTKLKSLLGPDFDKFAKALSQPEPQQRPK